jgi:arylsulfatase
MSNSDNQDEATGKEHAHKKSNAPSPAGKVNISRRDLLGSTSLIAVSAVASTALPSTAASQDANNATVLPKPEAPFEGKIGRIVRDSTPDFPKGVEAPAGAPNVLLILTDDVGFGATSTFGGPIQTPNFQRLADRGLRYNMYHTLPRFVLLPGRR